MALIEKCIRRGTLDIVAENILMWKLIDEAFDKFSDDMGTVDRKVIMHYVMKGSRGTLLPNKVEKALDELV